MVFSAASASALYLAEIADYLGNRLSDAGLSADSLPRSALGTNTFEGARKAGLSKGKFELLWVAKRPPLVGPIGSSGVRMSFTVSFTLR